MKHFRFTINKNSIEYKNYLKIKEQKKSLYKTLKYLIENIELNENDIIKKEDKTYNIALDDNLMNRIDVLSKKFKIKKIDVIRSILKKAV